MQRRKHIKVCLLMSVYERRLVCFLLFSGQGQVFGGGGKGQFARYQVDAIDIKLHTINHGQDLTTYLCSFFFFLHLLLIHRFGRTLTICTKTYRTLSVHRVNIYSKPSSKTCFPRLEIS